MQTQMLALEPSPAPMGNVERRVYMAAWAEGLLKQRKRYRNEDAAA